MTDDDMPSYPPPGGTVGEEGQAAAAGAASPPPPSLLSFSSSFLRSANGRLVSVPPPGKPVMIITEFMENGSLDTFLKVSHGAAARSRPVSIPVANQC